MDLVLVRTRNNPAPGVKKNSDSGEYSGRRMAPFGIMNIAAYCREQGHAVRLFDLYRPEFDHVPLTQIADQIAALKPRMVGISAMTSQSVDAMALGDMLMERSDTKVVHGGVHSATMPHDALKHGHYVVQGDGEHTMHELLVAEASAASASALPWANRPAVRQDSPMRAMAERNLKVVEADDPRIIPGKLLTVEEMAAIPFGTKKEFDETAFDPRLLDEFPIITARGCPYRCVFCKDGFGLRQSTVRYYPVDYVVDYLECIQKTWGFRRIQVLDDIFLSSVARMEEMADKLERRKLKFNFNCMVHANTVKPEFLKVMHRLGIDWVYVGVESGNERIHKLINKGTSPARVEAAVRLLKKNGFYTAGMFMLGNIGETVETIEETIRFAYRLPLDRTWFSFAAPYPGTPFFDMVKDYGEILEPDFAKWNQVSLVYKPKDVSVSDMHRLMKWAQAVRVYKKVRHTFIGSWEARLRKLLKSPSRPVPTERPAPSGAM
jgi:anaerobic magnesium-protoporphyrin IX monomethyl ester cyclase